MHASHPRPEPPADKRLHSLRRRFEQNQEDCTYTVLALLPTVRDEIIGALPVEQITEQLQQERQERLKRMGASEAASSEFPSVPPSVADEDGKSLSSSSFVHASQMVGSTLDGSAQSSRPKRSKAQLWQDMKINSITRALTLVYTLSLLTLLTRIQLNLLGRRTYLSSVVALASPPSATQSSAISLENKDDDNYDNVYGNDFETNRKYLTFSWWLLHRGSKRIMERVMAAVKEVFGPVNIREDLTLERVADLILQVRKKIEGETEEDRRQMRWLTYLMPPREEEVYVIRQSGMSEGEESPLPEAQPDPMGSEDVPDEDLINASLRRLLDETSDLIDSPTFSQVLTRVLDTVYSHLVDYRIATEAFKATGPTAPGTVDLGRVTEISDDKCKLAHILPVFCKQAHSIATGSGELDAIAGVAAQESLGNEYLAAIDRVHDLEAFAAVIYSSNFEYEVAEHGSSGQPSAAPNKQPSPPQPPITTNPPIPGSMSEVDEVPSQPTGDAARGDTSGSALSDPTQQPATAEADGAFEAAWKSALAEEDGKKLSNE